MGKSVNKVEPTLVPEFVHFAEHCRKFEIGVVEEEKGVWLISSHINQINIRHVGILASFHKQILAVAIAVNWP